MFPEFRFFASAYNKQPWFLVILGDYKKGVPVATGYNGRGTLASNHNRAAEWLRAAAKSEET
jgi:hypothetical protein